jgi:hypothetical protein
MPINKTIIGNTLYLSPVGNWPYGIGQSVRIPKNGLMDSRGNVLTGDWNSGFTTVGFSTPPNTTIHVTQVTPASAAKNVSVNAQITVTFNTNVQLGSNFNAIRLAPYNGTLTNSSGSLSTAINGNTLTLRPATALTGNTIYAVIVPAGAVMDGAGNSLATDFGSWFATLGQHFASPLLILPTAPSTSP